MATKTDSAAPLEEELRRLRGRVAELERALSASQTARPAAAHAAPPLATVVSHAPIVVWAVDCEGNFTLSEGSGLAGLGLQPGEVIGRNALEMYREVPAVCEGIRQALSGQEHKVDVEVAGRIFESWYAPQYGPDGRLAGATGVATDITEHVQAERLLREAEEKWRSLLEHVPDSVFTVNREGEILSINRIGPAFTREQVIGTHVENFVVPEHRGRVRDALETLFRTGESQGYEVLGEDGRGGQAWYSCRIGPIRQRGEIVAVAACATDVTERRCAEDELQRICHELETRVGERTAELIAANESLQREVGQRVRAEARSQEQKRILQSVLDSMGDGLIVADPLERLLLLNPAGAKMLKVDQSRAAESNWNWFQDAYLPDMVTPYPANERPIARAIRGESVAAEEIFFRWPGQAGGMWLQVSAQPLKDERGVQQGGVIVFRDITEQKRAEAALRRTEQRLQAFLDNTPAIIYLKDVQGRYLMANRACQANLQLTSDQIVGFTDAELYSSDVAALFRDHDLEVLRAKQAFQFEERAFFNNQWRTFLSVKFPLCDADGEPYALCGISTDITERKQAEENLRAEQQFLRQLIHAHERDRQLMAYEIHDGLVQYMSAALLHLEGINDKKDKLSTKSTAALELAAHLIRRSIGEGRRVMSGLRPPILDEAGIVLAIAYLVAEQASPPELQIDFTHRVSFERLEPLLEGTIFRIVQEALTNIKRHSKASRAEVKLSERDGMIRVEVRDWGVGFDPALVSKDRFGLEGIRKRAELMGGKAEIKTAPGEGTRVCVDLPIQVAVS
ncbi:MAG TPA: PAS domain-containing protein [Pirellulales bacterium]|jgi:PAS domain S-box-containing protein|nr:PAS domain-containing protein [Pirellulales bacterium]